MSFQIVICSFRWTTPQHEYKLRNPLPYPMVSWPKWNNNYKYIYVNQCVTVYLYLFQFNLLKILLVVSHDKSKFLGTKLVCGNFTYCHYRCLHQGKNHNNTNQIKFDFTWNLKQINLQNKTLYLDILLQIFWIMFIYIYKY